MPSRKSFKNGQDYGRPQVNGGYAHTYGYGYGGGPPPKYGSYNKYGANSGYGSYNPYGTVGYGGSMDRRAMGMRDGLYPGYDPYRPVDGSMYNGGSSRGGGGGGGVDDKWRHAYPYVPTSYNYQHSSRYVA